MQLSRLWRLRVRPQLQPRPSFATALRRTSHSVFLRPAVQRTVSRSLSTATEAPELLRVAGAGAGTAPRAAAKKKEENKPWQYLQHIATHFTTVQLLPGAEPCPLGTHVHFHRLPAHSNGVFTIGVFAPQLKPTLPVPSAAQAMSAPAPAPPSPAPTPAAPTDTATAAGAAAASGKHQPLRLMGVVAASSSGALAALMDQQRLRIEGQVSAATPAAAPTAGAGAGAAVTSLQLSIKLWSPPRERSPVLLALTHSTPSASGAGVGAAAASAVTGALPGAPLERSTLHIPYVASQRSRERARSSSPEAKAMAARTAAALDPVGDADRSYHPHGKAPKCACGLEARLELHSKPKDPNSPNAGRPFWRCPQKTRDKQCKFMRWADDRPHIPTTPTATTATTATATAAATTDTATPAAAADPLNSGLRPF